jgi:serine/threonine protein kinase/Tfp pilus assembly protein PilF
VSGERTGSASDVTQRGFVSGQRLFGRYTLVKILGKGGMGIVWLARDEELERDVALKFLPDLMVQDHAVFDQLKHETKRCLELTHPHIVRIHDFIHDERSGCISMEYIDGETLSNLRAEKEQKVFEPDEIATWTGQLCDALDYAHNRANVIHCDLKPANLMVNQRRDLKVTDFGIARSLSDSVSRLTLEQGRSGTLIYMSPQQLSGEHCTHLDDIYSLGASIYELLTSKPPFYSGNIDRQICERVAPSMTERRKELDIEPAVVPQVWEDAVAACLAKDPSRRPQSAAEVAQRLQLTSVQTRTRLAPGKRSNRKALVVAGIAVLFVVALAGLYFAVLKRPTKPVSQAVVIPEKSIAVLPFENLSEDKANAYFADGIQDEILTRLSKIADLKVISRTSTQRYKSAPENLPEIARQLGVAHILEGRVQKSGDTVRVNVQLIKAANDSHLWADTFDRKLTDIFSVESEVAGAIAEQLNAKLTGAEQRALALKPTNNVAAYDEYLRGRSVEISGITLQVVEAAAADYAEAVSLDPKFALAWARLAVLRSYLYAGSVDPRTNSAAAVKEAADQASTLQPESGEAWIAQGAYRYRVLGDFSGALQAYEEASKRLPNSADVFKQMAYVEMRLGRWEAAEKHLKAAAGLDPRNIEILLRMADEFLAGLRRFTEAHAVVDHALQIAPGEESALALKAGLFQDEGKLDAAARVLAQIPVDSQNEYVQYRRTLQLIYVRRFEEAIAQLQFITTQLKPGEPLDLLALVRLNDLGYCQEWAGRIDEARSTFARVAQPINQSTGRKVQIARAYAGLGDKEKALEEAQLAVTEQENDVKGKPFTEMVLAQIQARFGDPDSACAALPHLLEVPFGVTRNSLRFDPMWDPLRKDPRFQKLVASPTPKER